MTTSQGLLEELRDSFKDSVRISYTHILIKAVAKALEAHRMLNARVENEEIKVLEDINVGVAVALEGGLVVPVVRNANTKVITEVANILKDRVDKARQGTLSTREASGGTFTISNLGMFGIDLFAPIINPPETAILGVGRIVKKAVVKNEQITVSPTMTLTLVFDHRVLDGATAARFLQTLKQILEGIKEQDVIAR
jgi:pyruvate dehydrogenase E2 component (dihydrolipoamide acetyltransferase)